MKELVSLLREQISKTGSAVIKDRQILADRVLHLGGNVTFCNCDVQVGPNGSFVTEEDANVAWENCRFVGTLNSADRPVLSAPEESSIRFTDCRFENVGSLVCTDGALRMTNCEAACGGTVENVPPEEKPVRMPPNAAAMFAMAMNRTSGEPYFRFVKADGEDVCLENCTFLFERSKAFTTALEADHAVLKGCTLQGISKLRAEELKSCKLESCDTIHLETEEGENSAVQCIFRDCRRIWVESGLLSACQIDAHRDYLHLQDTQMDACTVKNIRRKGGETLDLYNCEINGCRFENITLTDNADLISADPESSVNRCTFERCKTTNPDRQIIFCESEHRSLFGTTTEDEDICFDCVGLELVSRMEDWEAED